MSQSNCIYCGSSCIEWVPIVDEYGDYFCWHCRKWDGRDGG